MTPPYQVMPNLTLDEYEELRESVRLHGVLVPVELDEHGEILDGHHRAAACAELGVPFPTITRSGMDENAKLAHILTLNLDRRHLTRDQRAELCGRLRKKGMSLRAIAEVVKVSEPTVLRDLRDTDVSPAEVTGRDGKTYPATRDPLDMPIRSLLETPDGEHPLDAEEDEETARFETLVGAADAVEGIGRMPADRVAASVPARRRATTARRLRRLGKVLGDVAWHLETMDRQEAR